MQYLPDYKNPNSLLSWFLMASYAYYCLKDPIMLDEEFDDLITNWSEISQKILLILNQKQEFFTKIKNPKSLMAFGAMGAHINMALQALKASEFDQ